MSIVYAQLMGEIPVILTEISLKICSIKYHQAHGQAILNDLRNMCILYFFMQTIYTTIYIITSDLLDIICII